MPESRLLLKRPGVETWFHPQPDGTFVIESKQDVEPALEFNKASAVEVGKKTRGKYMAHAAHVPDVVQYEWIKKYGFNPVFAEDKRLLRRLLDSNEWKYLRTSEIYLGNH
jgi:hypothetical protein